VAPVAGQTVTVSFIVPAAPMAVPEAPAVEPSEVPAADPPADAVPVPAASAPATSADFDTPADAADSLVLLGVPLSGAWVADMAGVTELARQVLAVAGVETDDTAGESESVGWLTGAAVLTAGVGYGLLTRPRRKWVPAGPGPGSVLALWTDANDPQPG
jgi:hypothetical protein